MLCLYFFDNLVIISILTFGVYFCCQTVVEECETKRICDAPPALI